MNKNNRICPVKNAGILDSNFRKLFHNPVKILRPYISNGMKVLDIGCGPGFFSLEIAKMVGNMGKVIAADIQSEMLLKIKNKIKDTDLQKIISLYECKNDKFDIGIEVDFALLFYMLHEVPDKLKFLNEIKSKLKSGGKIFIIEPKFHVSKNDFNESVELVEKIGFRVTERPKVLFSRAVLLEKKL